MAQARLERLSALDLSNLRIEDHGLPMHVAALIILDGAPLVDGAGQLRLDGMRAILQDRLHLSPRLRQVLYGPRVGLGPPVWVDFPGFDIGTHVQTRVIPGPGDEAALLQACCELNEEPLDRSRPLWQIWLLTGLADGRVGMLVRMHHVLADGIAALAMIGALFDPAPAALPSGHPASRAPAVGALAPATPLWVPRPVPGGWELAADSMRLGAAALGRGLLRLRRPSGLIRGLAAFGRQAGQLAREGRAPLVSVNRPVGAHRRLLLIRADLDQARTVAHAHGGKVNDVMLAAVAAGARAMLAARGELRPGLALKASVAVSVRGPADQSASGNRVGVMIVPLPVAEADPDRRLGQIVHATTQRKRQPPYQPSGRLLQRWTIRSMSRQRLINLLISNLPGPPAALRLAGAQALEMFQIGALQGNVTLSVGALSYAGQLSFDIIADSDAAPDLAVFAAGMSEELSRLGVLTGSVHDGDTAGRVLQHRLAD